MKQKKNELISVKKRSSATGCLLCCAMVFSGFLPVSASGTASSYEIEGVVLKITIPEGMTNEVDVSKVACANNNEITEIRKLGRGGLLMNDKTAIPNYTGNIYVDQGTWIAACTNALGKLSSNTDGSGVGEFSVGNGATLAIGGTDPLIKNDGKKISIEGTGVDGNGAIQIISTAGEVKHALGKNIVLTGDATIGMTKKTFYFYGIVFTFNGHKLTIVNHVSKTHIMVFNGNSTPIIIQSPGEIELADMAYISFEGTVSLLGSEGKQITFNDASRFKSNAMRGRYEWPMIWNSTAAVSMMKQTTSSSFAVTNRSTWHGSVRLDKDMKVVISANDMFGLMGPVSGIGGLNLSYDSKNIPETPTNFVNLANAGSTFEGGVSVRDLIVNVNENGAVPAEGGVFALTNSIVNFDSHKNYMLPNGIIHVDGDVWRSVSGGLGKWKTLVKTGAGTVNYDSIIGAEVLELKSGVMEISEQSYPFARFAGLVEGVEYFADTLNDQGEIVEEGIKISTAKAKDNGIVYTNRVVMSPYLMNTEMGEYWTTKRPADDTDHKVKAHCTTYSGYMWNRSNKSVDWTFACNVANYTVFHFDDELMFEHNPSSSKAIAKVTIRDIAPGSVHRIRIGNHSKYNKVTDNKTQGGISSSTTDPVWGKEKLGLRWDRLGRDTTDPANFEILADSGDGMLFTHDIPNNTLPEFDLVKFKGGTLHLNGVTNTVTAVEGMPLVAGTGKLIIENKWTIDAADIADGSAVSGLSFGFGADAELEIENSSAAKSMTGTREWTVIKSAEDITGSITVKDEDMATRWTVNIDGNEVKLKYRPFGTAVIIR